MVVNKPDSTGILSTIPRLRTYSTTREPTNHIKIPHFILQDIFFSPAACFPPASCSASQPWRKRLVEDVEAAWKGEVHGNTKAACKLIVARGFGRAGMVCNTTI